MVLKLVLRVGVSALALWIGWRLFGPFGLIFAAPVVGVSLARPLIDLVGSGYHGAREVALQEFQGRNFEHRGHRMDIAEDAEGHCWILLDGARKAVPGLPRDAVLQRLCGERLQRCGEPKGLRIRADALIEQLAKAIDADGVKFKVWLEREVVAPAARRADNARHDA
jgi:hypothetical protein